MIPPMSRIAVCCLSFILAGALLAAESPSGPDLGKLPPAASGTMDFQRDIQPILEAKCLACHGPAKQRGGLRLDRAADALKGGDSGAVLKPDNAKGSRLLLLLAGLDPDVKQMPPAPKPPLSPAEIGKLRAWIEQGAPWPKDVVLVAKEAAESAHWAYQPIHRPAPPNVAAAWRRHNEIDAFIEARLEEKQLTPSPEADRATLIRRLSFDLLGLPPTPEEVDAFLADRQPDAYERLVDRLLSSPHYGERWGRHWLDLARYADSDGYESDLGRPFAWRYRSWVIGAFNRDLPFDEFTIEQLAGDLLSNPTSEQKIATGFHRNTLTNREGGVDQEQFRVEAVVDRVNTTARVWLGSTINCCQCHDHKYDPFSQKEFYQFFAFFNSDSEVDLTAPLPGEEQALRPKQEAFRKKRAELQAAVAAYKTKELPAALEKWEGVLKPEEIEKLPEPIQKILKTDPEERSDEQAKQLTTHYAKLDKKLTQLNKAVTDHAKTEPKPSKAPTLALAKPRETHVLIRGDFLRPGAVVEPGTPSVLQAMPSGHNKTRLDLAKWLLDPANPLTSRVMVNWVWQKYFDRGLVPTLEDFGSQGEKPSHPELLDWLASEFVRRKWSLKALHKLIVTSATYRQSSQVRTELTSRDPQNVWLARQTRHRLEAEIVRDNALAVSGLLVRTIGGPSVRPPQPPGISELTYAGSARWVESTGPDRYRRGLYTWFQRTSPYPMLMAFDAPDSTVCCVRRERSNTPLQALTLLNDTVFVECAQALGKRLLEEKPVDVPERIRYAFRLCLAREPSSLELERLVQLYQDLLTTCRSNPDAAAKLVGKGKLAEGDVAEAAACVALARTLLNLDEFVTRE
jgi:hypothetical protein